MYKYVYLRQKFCYVKCRTERKLIKKKTYFESVDTGVKRNHARRTLKVYCHIGQTIVKLSPLN